MHIIQKNESPCSLSGTGTSACQKSPYWTFLTASTAEHFDFIKMLLRPKSLDFQDFSAADYWNARRVLTPSRTPAALSSAREA